jgi:C4-type Zn-finger protein
MLRDKIRCPMCKKEMKLYMNADDTKQIFLLTKEDTPKEQPIRSYVYTCSTCGNVQLFGVI